MNPLELLAAHRRLVAVTLFVVVAAIVVPLTVFGSSATPAPLRARPTDAQMCRQLREAEQLISSVQPGQNAVTFSSTQLVDEMQNSRDSVFEAIASRWSTGGTTTAQVHNGVSQGVAECQRMGT